MFIKPKNLVLGAAVVTILNYSSCKKYEDGPAFSLKSKTGRLTGEWELVEIRGSGDDDLSGLDYSFEFEKGGDFQVDLSYSYSGYSFSYSYKGDWEWGSDKESIEVTADGDRTEFDVLRLTNKELWVEDDWNDEWRFEKK
jgi:hypothetical protein